MVFNKSKYLIKVQGNKMYLPVSARLLWFRQEHPDWGVETQILNFDAEKQYAICKSTIKDETGRIIGEGIKREDVKGFGDYLEKASTGSIGRALAICGYSTDNEPDLDEGTERLVDSPQDTRVESTPAKGAKTVVKGKAGTGAPKVEEEKGYWSTCKLCQEDIWMDTQDGKEFIMLEADGAVHACETIEEIGDEVIIVDEFADEESLEDLLKV